MTQAISEIMTRDVVVVPSTTTLAEAAEQMRDRNIGDVVVQDAPGVFGILTDRDIVIRSAADGLAPDEVTVGDICTTGLTTLQPDDPLERAVELMRERAVRRLPIADNGRIVGILTLGDLAVERDQKSALGQISAADPQA
jgi:CBS domain-containing protein